MPKSKRAKVVHLSKTQKKGKELSERLFNGVRTAVDEHQYCFVFEVDNMRNTYLKEVRTEFPESRIYFGKTKVMAKALGLSPQEEHLPGLHKLSPSLTGNVGLFFTSQSPDTFLAYFDAYAQTDFARAGVPATRDFIIPAGVVRSRGGEIPEDEDVPMAHSLEPTLRKWGMPTRLVKGKIELDANYEVCKEGQLLNSNQTALLKIFGVATAEFKIHMKAYYDSSSQSVTVLESVE